MTVKVSSSVGETMLYTADRQTAKSDSQDSNWDINDPDIPARIDLHVSQNFDNFFWSLTTMASH